MLLCSLAWGDSRLESVLRLAEADPDNALAQSTAIFNQSPTLPLIALVHSIILNRAEHYLEAQSLLLQLESQQLPAALYAVCRWQRGHAARQLRHDAGFVTLLEESLAGLLNAGLEIDAARCRRDLAGAYYWAGKPKDAVEQITLAYEFFEQAGLREDAAMCALARSAQLRRQMKFDEAIAVLQDAEKTFVESNLPVDEAMTQLYQGAVYVQQMKFDAAKKHLHNAYQKFGTLGLNVKQAIACLESGVTSLQAGDLSEAETQLRTALKSFAARKMRGDVISAGMPLASIYFYQGRVSRSIKLYRYLKNQYERLQDEVSTAVSEMNIGVCQSVSGNYASALHHFEQARVDLTNLGATFFLAGAHHNIGKTWLELGDLSQAKEYLSQAATTYRESKALFPAARVLAYLALTEARQGHFAEALSHLTEAREICESQNARGYIAVCELIRGEILRRQGDLPQALDATINAEKLFGELSMRLNALSCQIQIADLHRLIGNHSHAARLYSQSLKLTQSALPDLAWRCAAGLAQLAEAQGELQTALEHHLEAVRYMGESRRWLPHESLVDSFLSSREGEIDRALHLAIRLKDSKTALTLVETHRAQLLARRLQNGRSSARPDPGLDSMRQRMTELRWRLSLDLNASIVRPPTPEHQAALDELDRLGKEHRTRIALTASATSDVNLPDVINPTSLKRIGAWSCLLYHWLDSQLLILAITESETTLHLCDLSPQDRSALDLCSSPKAERRRMLFSQNTVTRSHLRRLDSLLLPDPIRSRLKPDQLLIMIPSGALHQLPFQALHDGEKYLCERATLVHADSLTSLPFLLDRTENNNASPESALVFGVEDFGGRLPSLPHAKVEAQAISKVFAKATLIEEKTAAVAIKNLIETESPDVIHFATHAIVESQYGELSRLAFARDDLHADEIAGLRLHARLITLSACHSSLGQLYRGEENIGLRQAFFTAGAAAILSTLWAIEDDSAPQFMKEFYCALDNEKLSPAAALANTQQKRIADGKSLREWGAYILHGAP